MDFNRCWKNKKTSTNWYKLYLDGINSIPTVFDFEKKLEGALDGCLMKGCSAQKINRHIIFLQ